MERQRWNSLQEFGNYVYQEALKKKSLNSICGDHCSGTAKGKVKSANSDGFTLHLVTSNLSSVAQEYLDANTKSIRVPSDPGSVDCSGAIGVELTIHNIDWSYSKYEVHTQQSTSFDISGSGEYEGATLSGDYNQQNGKQTDSVDENSAYREKTMVITIQPYAGVVDFYANNYICSDEPSLDVDYDFDTINVSAVCQYKDSVTGVTFLSGKKEHYDHTYSLADLGINGSIVVSTPCLFNVNYKDEWPSWEINQKD